MEELVIDFRKYGRRHVPINVNGTDVEIVKSVKLLDFNIS